MDKQELYNKAKDAYYNSGEPIMSDTEFDELEQEIGLENKGYVGSQNNKSYTILHPFLMGSIEKCQIKEENGIIDFSKYASEVEKYFKKSKHYTSPTWYYETTPKLDGCSVEVCINYLGELISVSTRGNGEYGKDIKPWFEHEWEINFKHKIQNWIKKLGDDIYHLNKFVVRGECLVKKSIFKEKYSEEFTIPRSFVSGVLNQDWEGTQKQIEMRNDLSFVFYDYREVYENGSIIEVDYDETYPGNIIDNRQIHTVDIKFYKKFEDIYRSYEYYRNNISEYELDGIVIKPGVDFRIQDLSRPRQEDSVAIKFVPEIVETEIEQIEWNVSKTGEYTPVGICKEVILGGKKVSRVSLHNYDYIVRNCCGEGAKIRIVLSGDIIPQHLETINQVRKGFDQCIIPDDSYIIQDEKSGCLHLMKEMTDEEIKFNKFLNSVKVIKPDGIGEQVAKSLYFNILEVPNILSYMTDGGLECLIKSLDNSRSSTNIINSLINRRKTITLPEIIEAMGYENCGKKNSLWLAKKISNIDVPNDGIPSKIIELFETNDFKEVYHYMSELNIPLMNEEKSTGKIKVILTGKPTQYSTKKDFLNQNPQYEETTSWKECQILFTDSLESTSSKMQKAKKNGVEIKLY